MTYTEFSDKLKNGSLSGVYVMDGPEEFLKESCLKSVREALLPPGFEMMNENVFEGCGIQEVDESAQTLPFMCDKRLVIAKDPAFLMSSSSKDNDAEILKRLMNDASLSSVILLYIRGEANTKNALYAMLSKAGRAVKFDLLGETELARWASERIKTLGHSIKNAALNELVYVSGRFMQKLDIEINKLCAMAGSRKEITADDVRELVVPDTEVSVFTMLDNLIDKNAAGAYKILGKLRDSGESETRLLSLITRQLRFFAHISVLYEAGLSEAEAAAKLGEKNNYPFKKVYRACSGLSVQRLINCYKRSVESDFRIKSGMAEAGAVLEEMMHLLYNLKG